MSENTSSLTIDQSLARVLRQVRLTQVWRACWMIMTVALLGALLSMAVDWFFAPLPTWARWAIFGLWMFCLLLCLRFALAPMFRQISPVSLARWLECRHPEMQERISTALELQGKEIGISAGLLEELRRAAETDASSIDARFEVRSVSQYQRWARPACAMLGCLAVLFAAWPDVSMRLLVRAVVPFSNFGNAGAASFFITPGDAELLEGDALQIEVRYQGDANDVAFHSKWENGVNTKEFLAKQKDRYLYRLEPVTKSFHYFIRAGRDESDSFTVTVWPRPALVDPRMRVHAPDYLALEPVMEPLDDQVTAVCGSKFFLTSKTNTAIESARLEVNGKSIAEAKITTVSGVSQLALEWTIETPGLVEAKVILRHRLGHEVEAHSFAMEMVVDQAPQVLLLSPLQKQLRLRPEEQLELRYEVLEDFAIARVAVEVDDKGSRQVALGQNLPLRMEGSKPPRFRGSTTLSIGDLRTRMGGKRDFRIRLRAQDAKPSERSGPGIGYSDWLEIRIDEQAESLVRQELRQQHEGAMKEIDETIRQVREAREQMDQHKEQVKKGELTAKVEKALQEAAEKLAEAQEKTHQLGQKMEESVHAPLATDVKQAAEKMQQSRESLENAPLQDEEAQREDKMQQARDQAEESIRKLEQVKQEMQKQNEKIQDLAKLQELAQKQQEVARQAQQQADAKSENSNEKSEQDWRKEQEQVAQQLRAELQQQPQALVEALKEQARQAQQLAQQAEEISQSQEQLKQQAQQAASAEKSDDSALQEQTDKPRQQAIQQALAQEQAKIAAETEKQLEQARAQRSALADELPAAQAATENAKEQLAQQSPDAAAKATKAAQETLERAGAQASEAVKETEHGQARADAAEKSNDQNPAQAEDPVSGESSAPAEASNQAEMAAAAEALENLTERQAMVAQAAQALAEGNIAEALEQLQQAQAQRAQELAQAIATTPQAQPSAPMRQAEQNSQQGSQQAQQAAQQAQQGQQKQAAQQHSQAQQNFAQSAQALAQAAREMSQSAAQAAQQQTSSQQAPASPEALAEAFQQAARASESTSPQQAAQQSQRAAQALQQAAQSAKSRMQGQSQPSTTPPSPQASSHSPPGNPSEQASEMAGDAERPAEADPGVPPELAKLGISAADWEKIQNNLRADVGGGGAAGIPEEYRELVKGYFQSMSTNDKKK
ncbi:MAG: hypothetical protein ACOVRB_08815 [Akkermansiaceae bacterium]